MANFFESLKNFINEGDTFAKSNNMRITTISEGHAEAEVDAGADSRNARGLIQGGVMFTLADLAFAGAANSFEGLHATSMTAHISFLRPGTGSRLFAVADVINRGRRSCLVEVAVTDERGKLVAKVSITGFFIQEENGLAQRDN